MEIMHKGGSECPMDDSTAKDRFSIKALSYTSRQISNNYVKSK